jgi:hypothetical protein
LGIGPIDDKGQQSSPIVGTDPVQDLPHAGAVRIRKE